MLVREKPIFKLFLRTKPVKMLVSLKKGPRYATVISKEVDCTYSHTVKLLSHFEKNGIVTFNKKGRIKIIELTEEGQELVNAIEKCLRKLSKLKQKS